MKIKNLKNKKKKKEQKKMLNKKNIEKKIYKMITKDELSNTAWGFKP